MDKKRVVMVDCWSVCDFKGKPIGHGIKVANEYYEYIKDEYEVIQYANEGIISFLNNPKKKKFTYSLSYGMSKFERVWHCYHNICQVFQKEKDSTIWFYIPEIYVFLFVFFKRKGKRKIVFNVYDEYIGNYLKHKILKGALKKADGVFVANKNLLAAIPNGILIPDYAYREDYYKKFQTKNKKEQVVCLGTMNEKKHLVKAVEVFSKNGYPLIIIGQFESDITYKHLMKIKGKNVVVENRYADEEEYYRLLGESKFCLIPYDEKFYKNRTSGVLQECLFVGTIPISHREILEFGGANGIGYEVLDELKDYNFKSTKTESFLQISYSDSIIDKNVEYVKNSNDLYDYGKIKKEVIDGFNKSGKNSKSWIK